MDFAVGLADRYHTTPFDIFDKEAIEVIWLINHFLEKADEQEEKETFKNYILINPKVISTSEEIAFTVS